MPKPVANIQTRIQRVNVDFPIDQLEKIDALCKRLGVSRQAWIKVTLDNVMRDDAPKGKQR